MPTVKWFLGSGLLQFVQRGLDHGRSEFFGGKAVASADHFDVRPLAFDQRIDDIQVKRFADGARFLGAVEDRNRFDGLG